MFQAALDHKVVQLSTFQNPILIKLSEFENPIYERIQMYHFQVAAHFGQKRPSYKHAFTFVKNVWNIYTKSE